jgi:hypothetical protein
VVLRLSTTKARRTRRPSDSAPTTNWTNHTNPELRQTGLSPVTSISATSPLALAECKPHIPLAVPSFSRHCRMQFKGVACLDYACHIPGHGDW